MRRLALLLAVAVAACKPATQPVPRQSATPAAARAPRPSPAPPPRATPTPTAHASASATSNGARTVSEETDDFLFEYSYPKEAGRIPELAAMLDRRLEKARADLAKEAAEARQQAKSDGFPYNKHSVTTAWKVVVDLPDWLSLSADIASFSGGAHGNYGFDSLVWNKQAGRGIEAADLFQSPAALEKALGTKLCASLDKERAKRRKQPVPKVRKDEFDKCVPVKDATVLVGSRSRRAFDRVELQLGPYTAGPYAEGSYQFTFPVDASVLAAVKPEYRAAFASRK